MSNQGTKPSDELIANYWYVNLPILLHYKQRNYFLNIGPQIGMLLGGKIKEIESGVKESVTGKLNNINFSLALAIGLPLTQNMALEGRYNLGLSNTSMDHDPEGEKLYNRVFQLSFVYTFLQ